MGTFAVIRLYYLLQCEEVGYKQDPPDKWVTEVLTTVLWTPEAVLQALDISVSRRSSTDKDTCDPRWPRRGSAPAESSPRNTRILSDRTRSSRTRRTVVTYVTFVQFQTSDDTGKGSTTMGDSSEDLHRATLGVLTVNTWCYRRLSSSTSSK